MMFVEQFLKAGYPALCVLTHETDRAEHSLPCEGWEFFAWDCVRGIRSAGKTAVIDEIRDPVEAVNWLGRMQNSVLIARHMGRFFDIPEVIQAIENNTSRWKATGCSLIVLTPVVQLPPELEKTFRILELPLPNEQELIQLQTEIAKSVGVAPDERSAVSAKGLTLEEAEEAFALSLVQRGSFSSKVIAEAKAQIILKSGMMQLWQSVDIQDVGGLQPLKSYIESRARAFLPGNEGLPKPRGVILMGISGCGKSLSAKAISSVFGWPLLRLDVGAIKGSLVGQTEMRMRQCIQTVEAFGQCVLWIDEIDKAWAGIGSSGETDGGTTSSAFGTFLTWLQEATAPVYTVATANDITRITKYAPEFIRAGRFDTCFWVDVPSVNERREILEVLNRRYGTDIPISLAEKLNGFTGAEIQQVVVDSLYDGLENALSNVVPISRSMKENIQALRDWAKNRCRIANSVDEPGEQRKIRALN